MKLRLLAATLAALTLAAGSAFAQSSPALDKNSLSYALGYDLGRNLIESGEAVDVNTVIKALQDGYAKREPTVPVAQLRTAVESMQKRQVEKAKAAFEQASAQNKAKSDQFLAQNKAKAGVQSLPGGIQYRVVEAGNGANFALVPHVHPSANGILSGVTGAGGNLGGVVFAIIFRFMDSGKGYDKGLWIIGVVTIALNLAVCWIPPRPKGQIGGQ